MQTFDQMGLPASIITTLQDMQFTTPTPIQAQAIPLALENKDILGSAQTGTGKTAAFGIPLITKVLENPHSEALVMTPTRELAQQVIKQLHTLLGGNKNIKTALLIGGEPMPKQHRQLQGKPRIVVGTPGRIYDHLQRKSLTLSKTDFLVLDETDRMLDMGFTIQIDKIMRYLNKNRQTLLFSATLPKSITTIASKYQQDPVRIAVESTCNLQTRLKQSSISLKEADKYHKLLEELTQRDGSIIIFVKTKIGTDRMASKLHKEGHSAEAIHGDLRQHKRNKVINAFRNKKHRILVATDVAARGLDIPHVKHVINYDLPQCAEDYVHRIGRTARAGATGEALNFITSADKKKWSMIEQVIDPSKRKEVTTPRASSKKPKKFFSKRFDSPNSPKRFNTSKPRPKHKIKRKEPA